MKNIISILAACAMLSLSGCSTLQKINAVRTYETSAQTAEQIIASAEKTVEIADLTFNEFLLQERKYSKEIKAHAPKVHSFAEFLRKKVDYKGEQIPNSVQYLKKARAATEAFRENRTGDGEANLRTAIASVKALLDQAKTNLTEMQSVTKGQ